MSEKSKFTQLAEVLKFIERERKKIVAINARATPEMSRKSMMRLQDDSIACGVEIRRLSHEAHCLAVEIGIADLRAPEHYRPTTASIGFGREVKIEKRTPDGVSP